MISLASLKRNNQFRAQVPILAAFGYLGLHSKSILSPNRQDFEKLLVSFLGEVVRNIVVKSDLCIFKNVRG